MGIEEVQPDEERRVRGGSRRARGEPLECAVHGVLARTLSIREVTNHSVVPQLVVVTVKSLAEVVPAVEHLGRHEGLRLVAFAFQTLGESLRRFRNPVGPVVPNSVRGRFQAGQDRGVRWKRERRRRDGTFHSHSLGRQPIDVACPCLVVTVAPEAIRTEGVHRDEDDVWRGSV
jgi:hypothetical protein